MLDRGTSPVIALLTEIKEGSSIPDFGKVHSFCEELHQGISNQGGLFYVFSLQGFSEEGVIGFQFVNDQWKEALLPLPDVVYNRISSRRVEYGKEYNKFLNKLQSLGIKIFNQRFLSKWEVVQFLAEEEHLQPYMPESKLFDDHSLQEMLSLHDELYVKPAHGSQGRQIIRLLKGVGGVKVSFSSLPEKDYAPIKRTADLFSFLSSKIGKRIFILQQGIPFASLKGRKLDFRALCHKNPQQFWQVTSIVARVSAEEHFVSNIARGGEMMRPFQTLSLIFGKESARQQLSLMKELAVETAEAIARHADGATVELGIDIGVDLEGKLWMIEANSKPSKNFEDRSQKLRPSTRAIIAYCFSLPKRNDQ